VDRIPDWLVHVRLIPVIVILKSESFTVSVEANLRTLIYIKCGTDCSWTDALVIGTWEQLE
jgi:hypothetical protein